jgi:hypothetical protein
METINRLCASFRPTGQICMALGGACLNGHWSRVTEVTGMVSELMCHGIKSRVPLRFIEYAAIDAYKVWKLCMYF